MAGDSPRPCFFMGGTARETRSDARVASEGPCPTERTAPVRDQAIPNYRGCRPSPYGEGIPRPMFQEQEGSPTAS